MPNAGGFLWNRRMMIQVTCRGYATAQFMQPEPAKYAHAPALEAKTFMQPEQPYYAHHPGRFCYVKDEDDGALFSVPHAPVNREPEAFRFSVGAADAAWTVRSGGLEIELAVRLPADDVAELWTLRVRNLSGRARRLSLYPYFPVGYMSWMNQSGRYRADLGGIVCDSVTPYQKVEDWFRQRGFKDRTVLLHDRAPDGWEACQAAFEGAVLGHELMHRQQLDGRHAQVLQVVDDGRRRNAGVSAAQFRGHVGVQGGQALHVGFVNDRLVQRRARVAVVLPVEVRIGDDRARDIPGTVSAVHPPTSGVVPEHRPVPVDLSFDGACVRVEQQLRRVAAMAVCRIVRSMDAEAVPLAGLDAVQVAVPAIGVDLR